MKLCLFSDFMMLINFYLTKGLTGNGHDCIQNEKLDKIMDIIETFRKFFKFFQTSSVAPHQQSYSCGELCLKINTVISWST